jgi:alpha-beta hydrolase superfamily lysophospholipase
MVEYIERYAAFAEFLTGKGILVTGHDHLGHGQSVSSQEDWGYIGLPHPSNLMVEDMHTLRTMVQAQYPDVPYFMMGHSMGSYMLRKYLCIHPDGVDGAILMGTGTVAPAITLFGMGTVRLRAVFHGWHYRSRFVAESSFGRPYRRYDLTGKDAANSWLSKNEKSVRAYYADPRCTFTFTLNGYLALYEAVFYAVQSKNAAKLPKKLPLLLVSGKDDPVGDFGAGVRKAYDMYKGCGIEDITCRLYENDRHEIINETDREDVYADILSWMNVRIRE